MTPAIGTAPGGARGRCVVAALLAFASPVFAAEKIDFSTYRPAARQPASRPPKRRRSTATSRPVCRSAHPSSISSSRWSLTPARRRHSRTVARVLYDLERLRLVSFYNYSIDVAHIPSGAKARDTNVEVGEFVRIYLDPGLTRRNGYAFSVNPRGGKLDALIQNNSAYLDRWNTIWDVKVGRQEDGWTAEFKIPFRSISYDAKRADWGSTSSRFMRDRRERKCWTLGDRLGRRDRYLALGHAYRASRSAGDRPRHPDHAALRDKHEWAQPGREDDSSRSPATSTTRSRRR
ncbi:MAG: hypothetical protein U1E87_01545 [Alphaproteobacteria bacterium]